MGVIPKGYFSCPKAAFVLLGLIFLEACAFLVFLTTNTSFWIESVKVSEKVADDANFIYGFLVSFSPLITGFLADNFFGRYWMTIVHLAMFIIGFGLMCGSTLVSLPSSAALGALGMLSISFAVGINKGVVPTFNADQFRKGTDDAARNRMLSWYYLVVNVGGVVSIYTFASLKDWVTCFDEKCYLLTFGSCMICVTLALLIFLSFRKWFVRSPRSKNIVIEAFKCIFCAILNRGNSKKREKNGENAGKVEDGSKMKDVEVKPEIVKEETKKELEAGSSMSEGDVRTGERKTAGEDTTTSQTSSQMSSTLSRPRVLEVLPTGSWMDRAYPKYDRKFIADVAQLLRVTRMFFIGIPFWTCYQTMFGGWMRQFEHANGQVGEMTFTVLIYMTLNPITVVLSIYALNSVIYPLLSKCVKVSPLCKMTCGGFVAVLSFVFVLIVEYKVEATQLASLNGSRVELWRHPDIPKCDVTLSNNGSSHSFEFDGSFAMEDIEHGDYEVSSSCIAHFENATISVVEKKINVFALYPSEYSSVRIVSTSSSIENKRTESGSAHYYVISCQAENICEYKKDDKVQEKKIGEEVKITFMMFQALDRELRDCKNSTWLSIPIDLRGSMGSKTVLFDKRSCDGGNATGAEHKILVSPNGFSSLWMWPQNLLFAIVESLLAVGALEFAYNQTSVSMKSVVQALWLLTAAFGSLIGLFINQLTLTPIIKNYIYATMMLVATLLFMLACKFYRYVPEEVFLEEAAVIDGEETTTKEHGKRAEADRPETTIAEQHTEKNESEKPSPA